MISKIEETVFINLVLLLIHIALAQQAVYKVPADPLFSDDVTDYDDPTKGLEYYDVLITDYPYLPNEWDVYRKTKPGGLLPPNEKSKQLSKPSKAPKPSKVPKPSKSKPMTTPRSPKFTTNSKYRFGNNQDRELIDGSDPNTDLTQILRQRHRNRTTRRPAAAPQPGQTPRDMVGNEIKPETPTNQFFIKGKVTRCRWTKSETVTHRMSRTVLTNPDITVTGVTIEAPRTLKNIIKHRFQALPEGGGKMVFLTDGNDEADLKVNWYSCGKRRKQ